MLLCHKATPSSPAGVGVLHVQMVFACADVLAGRKTVGTIKGAVVFAGHKPSRSFLRRYTGYVEQFGDALLFRHPTTAARTEIINSAASPDLTLADSPNSRLLDLAKTRAPTAMHVRAWDAPRTTCPAVL
jgi:hypothetical protein